MPRFLIPFFLLIFHATTYAQTATQIAETKCHAFRTVVGKNYRVSVSPDAGSDAVLGIGFDPDGPMAVINSGGSGQNETHTIEAASDEMQVCVYTNQKGAKHTFLVLDEDQAFPFFMWTANSTVALETDERGFIEAFRFKPRYRFVATTKANTQINGNQVIAGNSGISYTFKTEPGVPLDFLLVPKTNHLDLAVHADSGNGYEVIDFNRSASDISATGGGQVEWFQTYPTGKEVTIVVANKSSFGGEFKLAVRNLLNMGTALPPGSWRYLDPFGLKQFIDASRVGLPLISETQAVTYELTPSRLIEAYSFEAYALEPGLEFALFVRTDPNKPPLIVQAGGVSVRSATFDWNVSAGRISLPSNAGSVSEQSTGFPEAGKIQITIVGYGGTGRVGVSYKDAERLASLDLPPRKNAAKSEVVSLFAADYDQYELIDSNFSLYRFAAIDGQSYSVKVSPDEYFDVVIMDPSGRTSENPTSLELIDKSGRGYPETLNVTARGEILEFAVTGIRYVHGRVKPENKRFGGIGFFKYEVTDADGKTPEFLEKVEVGFPNEFVSNETGLAFQPWDPVEEQTASELPPFVTDFDARLVRAFGTPVWPPQ